MTNEFDIAEYCNHLDSQIDDLKRGILGDYPTNEEDENLSQLIDLAIMLGERYVYRDNVVTPKGEQNE